METLVKLGSERDWGRLYMTAVWWWSRQNSAALDDLRTSLGISGTVEAVDPALRAAAQDRYEELLQWCIRTHARLDGSAVKNPATWLPDTVRSLENARVTGGDAADLLWQIETVDELLAAASDADLVEAALHLLEYRAVRIMILDATPA